MGICKGKWSLTSQEEGEKVVPDSNDKWGGPDWRGVGKTMKREKKKRLGTGFL